MKLIGPFSQLLTLRHLALKGSLCDAQLEVIDQGAVLVDDGIIEAVGEYYELVNQYPNATKEFIDVPMVGMPGLVDAHTHICYAGTRANDYALRLSGKSYQEIAKQGGGIRSTVNETRKATSEELLQSLLSRCNTHYRNGVTTAEVKSGYGLTLDDELKMLRVIQKANLSHPISLISTCLAAHTLPEEYESKSEYLQFVANTILPAVKEENLCSRVDIFVEPIAFEEKETRLFLKEVHRLGFDITIHADQFTRIGSRLAFEFNAMSADHLEASGESEINLLALSNVVGVLLPGASLGLGMHYPKGRMMLDKGMAVAIASDWNPGSAPMGDLLMQAAVFGAAEKLTMAETFAAITFRAANALGLTDRGVLDVGKLAHIIGFETEDYQDILYYQGSLRPSKVWS